MIIRPVTFEIEVAGEELLKGKINADLASLKAWDTCIAAEAWIRKDRKKFILP